MSRRPDANTILDEGWILSEDWALRQKLGGMLVTDQQARARKVDVWFGHPDQEIREQTYPYVTIDLLEVREGMDRVHRGNLWLDERWGTQNFPKWWDYPPLEEDQRGYLVEMTTPIDLFYQITTWSRNPRHDRQMMAQMMTGGRVMLRGGWLETPDGKIRRMDFHGHAKNDQVDANQKRLFVNTFRVMISSEIPFAPIGYGRWGRVEEIHLRFTPGAKPTNPYDPVPGPDDVVEIIRGSDTQPETKSSAGST
jgi:hypothetical protein